MSEIPREDANPESALTPEPSAPVAPAPSLAPLEAVPPPLPSPWTFGELGYFIAFAAGWLVVSGLVTVGSYAVLKPWMGWHTTPATLQHNPFFALASQIVFYGPLLWYVYHLVAVRYHLGFWSAFNWRKPSARQLLRFFLFGILLAFFVVSAPTLLPDHEGFPLQQLFSSPAAAYAVAGFAVLVAPFMEELIFRGFLFTVLERQANLVVAVAGTALLFSAFHVPEYWGAWNHLLLVSLAGVVFSLARGLTGSLAPSVMLHLAYNASLMAAFFFETGHFHWLR